MCHGCIGNQLVRLLQLFPTGGYACDTVLYLAVQKSFQDDIAIFPQMCYS